MCWIFILTGVDGLPLSSLVLSLKKQNSAILAILKKKYVKVIFDLQWANASLCILICNKQKYNILIM